MNTSIFWRLAWKEYRQQRDLMVAIALITLVLLGIMLAWHWVENHELPASTAFHLALAMPVFYALGCGATLFAGEHERETFAFLRALPLHSRSAFWPKAAVALGSTLGLAAALVLMAALFTRGRFAVQSSDAQLMVYSFLVMGEVLVWSMLASQLLKHPFWAIAASGVAYFATLSVVMAILSLILPTPADLFTILTIVRCVLLLVLAVVNIALGSSWLERERSLAAPLERATAGDDIVPLEGPATRWTMFGRLWWQAVRESGWIAAAIYGGLILLSVLIVIEGGPAALVWVGLPALVGSVTFFQDQWKQQYRFFAEHGVAPRTLWWARILAGAAMCLPWLAVLAVAAAADARNNVGFQLSAQARGLLDGPGEFLMLGVLFFAWGQWCSLLFRAGIVGLFVGIAMSVCLTFAFGMLRFLGIPDWLGVFVPAASLLWASWWRAPDWLTERNSWRRWFAYAGMLAVPLALYFGALIAHRVYEIPQLVGSSAFVSGPGGVNIPAGIAAEHRAALAELQRPATADELETAKLYRSLLAELRHLPASISLDSGMGSMGAPGAAAMGATSPSEMAPGSGTAESLDVEQWNRQRAERLAGLVERFVEISQRPAADFYPQPFQAVLADETRIDLEFSSAVLADARRLDDAEEFDGALQRHLALLRFARHFQQRGGLQQIDLASRLTSTVYDGLLTRASRIEQPEESILAMSKTLNGAPYDFSPDYDVAWLRTYALNRGVAEMNSAAWEAAWPPQALVNLRRTLHYLPWERTRMLRLFDYQSTVASTSDPRLDRWRENTILQGLQVPTSHDLRMQQEIWRTQRAAIQLRGLLLAWKAEHGELPESLADLEQDYPGKVPLVPATNQPWVYRPRGVADYENMAGYEKLARPFIWSPANVVGSLQTGFARVVVSPANDSDLARNGQVFVIEPESADDLSN